jgi:hypothetical protein
MQRPFFSQSPKRVGSAPAGPPISPDRSARAPAAAASRAAALAAEVMLSAYAGDA